MCEEGVDIQQKTFGGGQRRVCKSALVRREERTDTRRKAPLRLCGSLVRSKTHTTRISKLKLSLGVSLRKHERILTFTTLRCG